MLRYTINRRDANTSLRKLDVAWFSAQFDDADTPDAETLTLEKVGRIGYTVTVQCNTPHDLSVGDKVAITVDRRVAVADFDTSNEYSFYEEHPVTSVSQDGLTFTFDGSAFYSLDGDFARIVDETVEVPYTAYGDNGEEHEYSVEENRRYIYLNFKYNHFFREDMEEGVFFIKAPNEGDFGEKDTLAIACEYVARNVLKVRVPKSDRLEDDDDRISYFNTRIDVNDFECPDGGTQGCSEDGSITCNGEEQFMYQCDRDGVYYEVATYYYDTVTMQNDGEFDETDGHPWVKVTPERIEENGDHFSICDNVLCELIGEDCSRNTDACVDGVSYRKLTPEEYDSLEDYKLSDDGMQAYIKDYAYTFVPGKSAGVRTTYYLVSDYERYAQQQLLYPEGDGELSDEWLLNRSLFGYNVSAEGVAELSPYVIFRDTFLYDMSLFGEVNSTVISAVRSMCSVDMPLSHEFSPDINNEAFTEEFIATEREKAINPVREMEKNVYHPLVQTSDDTFGDVTAIQFNLHFRRRDDNWNVVPKGFWNGVQCTQTTDGEDVTLNYRLQDDYFPVAGSPERFSDILSMAHFTNNDVRYQKNVLKKSFLRLSFYDSDDETRQRLLAYYTVFYDSGKAFKIFSQNFDTSLYYGRGNNAEWGWDGSYKIVGRYVETDGSDESEKIYKYDVATGSDLVWGVRVSRDINTDSVDFDNINGHRLSTQFVVNSRNTSTSSSEGFYIYLWKDDYNPPYGIGGCVADEIYMRVDFNHAGFGRTLPFMMPHSGGKILSFGEILDQWRTNQQSNDINRFREYAYIRLKRGYDTTRERFFYYPDPERYGFAKDGNNDALYYDSATDTLMYNLYEGKIYEGE